MIIYILNGQSKQFHYISKKVYFIMAPIVLSCRTRHLRPLVWVVAMCFSNGMHQIISDYYWRRWLIQITLVARSLAQRGAWRWGTICHWHSLKMHCASCKMWWVTHVCVEFGHSHHMSSNQEFQTAAILTFLNSSGWRGTPGQQLWDHFTYSITSQMGSTLSCCIPNSCHFCSRPATFMMFLIRNTYFDWFFLLKLW